MRREYRRDSFCGDGTESGKNGIDAAAEKPKLVPAIAKTSAAGMISVIQPAPRSVMNSKLKVFLSHSSKDKKLASDLKDVFETFGIDVFVAHQDIMPSTEWQRRILQELRACDVFLALLSKNFLNSDWTDQESGIALYLKKVVIPIRVSVMPYGFMATKQAHPLNAGNLSDSCTEMGKAIDGEIKLRKRFRHHLIQAFVGSHNFSSSIAAAIMITELEGFTAKQVNDITKAAYENDQIYGCKAMGYITGFIERNHRKISAENMRRIQGEIVSS